MKMKIKKFAAVLLAVLLTFALCVPAFAAFDADDYNSYVTYSGTGSLTGGTITIVPSEGEDLSGTSFKAYKVFDLVDVYVGLGNVTHYAYALEPAFYTLFAGSNFLNCNAADVTSEAAYNYVKAKTSAAQLNQFGKDVAAYAAVAANGVTGYTGTAGASSYVFSKLEAGLYVIADTTTASATYNPMAYAVVTNYNDVIITRKGTTPTIDKSVVGAEDSDNDGIPNYAEAATGMIGAKVPYQLTSKIPNMTGIASYTFEFADTLSSGLTYNNDLVVKIGTTTLAAATDYTATCVSNVLTITFITTSDNWKAANVGDEIVATYSATINSSAIVNILEDNTAKVVYSNSPTSTNSSVPSKVKVSELDFTIKKTNDEVGTPTALAGAEFALYTTVNTTDTGPVYGGAVKFTKGTGGVYYVDSSGSETLTSDDSGLVELNGLEAGVYYLVETKAPTGYNLLTGAVTITVKAKLVDLDSDGDADDIQYYAVIDNGVVSSTTVINTTGVILPSTGGIGTTLFTVGGILIILLSGVFLVVNRKKVFGSGK